MSKITVAGRFIGGGLFESRESMSGKKQYSACIVLEDAEAKQVQALVDAAVEEEFGKKKPKNLQDWGVRVGDDEEFESYEKHFINPKSAEDKPPGTVIKDPDGVLTPATADDIYPGCNVAVSLNAYAYPGNPKKSIQPGASLRLLAVMFMSDGDPLTMRFKADDFAGFESQTEAVDADDILS